MGLFDKIKNTAKSAANTVQQTASNAVNTVEHVAAAAKNEIKEKAEDFGSVVVKGGTFFVNGIETLGDKALSVVKGNVLEFKDEFLEAKSELKAELDEFIDRNKEVLKLIGTKMKGLQEGESRHEVQRLKSHAVNRDNARTAAPAMMIVSDNPQFREANEEVQKIGKYQTWSFQLAAEANLGLGFTYGHGYATSIFEGSNNRIEDLKSVEFDLGVQQGVGVGLAWGWWVAPPQELEGGSFFLSVSGSNIAGLGLTGYWDIQKTGSGRKFQGFVVNPFIGAGLASGASFEFAGGVGYSW